MLLFQKSGTVGRTNGDESKSFKIYYCHIWRSNHPLPAAILGYLGNPRDLGYKDFDLELSQFLWMWAASPRILAILCITMFCTTATWERFNSSFGSFGCFWNEGHRKKQEVVFLYIYRVAYFLDKSHFWTNSFVWGRPRRENQQSTHALICCWDCWGQL